MTIPVRKCFKVNCNNLIPFTETYCDDHKDIKNESTKSYETFRYERDKQFIKEYNSKVWKQTRKSIMLRDDGLCQYCLAEGIISKAEVVDHFIPMRDDFDKRFDVDNLVASCIRHNTLKEKDEQRLRNKQITLEEYKSKWKYGDS
ncbi:HNH endonuclease [Mammaliicoccus sciuri]|uniref:HNH endonuclease n=1 Tax=Mammaliicoccus sciuri TaxID=1296 RepID=UPI001E55D99D|nr:HNH endonuclease [Mammaliicoccus sciuri]MCD3219451.1 HNH endonuclease [Mammaliicoccus sciuri]